MTRPDNTYSPIIPQTFDPSAQQTPDPVTPSSGEDTTAQQESTTFQDVPSAEASASLGTTFKQSIISGGMDTLFAKGAENAVHLYDQYLSGTPQVGQDEVDQIKKDRPGINFPDNPTKSVVDDITQDYDEKQIRDQILSYSPSGVMGGATQFLGGAIGALITDPVSLATAGAGGIEAAASMGESELSKLAIGDMLGINSPKWQSAVQRAVMGSAEGAAFGVAQEAGNSIDAIANGDSLDGMQALQNIGLNMFLGTVLHPIGGFVADRFKGVADNVKPFDADSSRDATQSAANMMGNGMDPDPSLSLRDGFNKASSDFKTKLAENNIKPEEMYEELNKAQENLDKGFEDKTNFIKEYESKLKDIGFKESDIPKIQESIDNIREFKPDLNLYNESELSNLKNQLTQSIDDLKQREPDSQQISIQQSYLDDTQSLMDKFDKVNQIIQTKGADFKTGSDTLTENHASAILSDYKGHLNDKNALELQKMGIMVRKTLLDNTEDALPKDVIDQYTKLQQATDKDFANGRGQESLDAVGKEFDSVEDLVNDRFPPEEEKRIMDEAEDNLTDEERAAYDEVKEGAEKVAATEKSLSNFIKCAFGALL
jgi:hypothetical protein